jgi:hypothetical protein
MQLSDFYRSCEKCDGKGQVNGGPVAGTHEVASWGRTCEACKGQGSWLTDDGLVMKQLFDKLQKDSGLYLKRA